MVQRQLHLLPLTEQLPETSGSIKEALEEPGASE